MIRAEKIKSKTLELKDFLEGVETKVMDLLPESTVKSAKQVKKEVIKTISKLESEAQCRLKQAAKLLRIPTKEERVAARRARVTAAAKTFGLVTEEEFHKLLKKVNSLKKELSTIQASATKYSFAVKASAVTDLKVRHRNANYYTYLLFRFGRGFRMRCIGGGKQDSRCQWDRSFVSR
ncbi:MAG TPA: hypothetical protein VJL87_04235 [Bdellovibrionota bacterium]|nr:hypothetical protein [Bdellovibrionota bacterium]